MPTEITALPPDCRVLLLGTGGSPEPLLAVLKYLRPAHVWYFCSSGTRAIADAVHGTLDWHPDRDFIQTNNHEELGPCYADLRRAIPGLLGKWQVSADDVIVDYTGGTKTMSAALVLAASEIFTRFSYVGGSQREKAGLGTVSGGAEVFHLQPNPWEQLAVREIDRAAAAWDNGMFDAAAATLRDAASKVSRRKLFLAMADLAEACAARRRLAFGDARQSYGKALQVLEILCEGSGESIQHWARSALELCLRCNPGKAQDKQSLLRELLDNALATAAQGRFEDAAARLYRAMEMHGQILLEQATGGSIANGQCKQVSVLAPELRALPFLAPDDQGGARISMEQVYRALAALGDPTGRAVCEDLAKEKDSRWRKASQNRNASILAHGTATIGRDGFGVMKAIASEMLGFDLSTEAHPIPSFPRHFFQS